MTKVHAQLGHIGIAAADVPALKKLFSILGLDVTHVEAVPEQGVNTHFLPISTASASLELLEPTNPEGAVAGFMKKRGPGVHHLAFEVNQGELEALCETLKSSGYRLLYEQCKAGAHGKRVNFIHPGSAGGILVEVMESA